MPNPEINKISISHDSGTQDPVLAAIEEEYIQNSKEVFEGFDPEAGYIKKNKLARNKIQK